MHPVAAKSITSAKQLRQTLLTLIGDDLGRFGDNSTAIWVGEPPSSLSPIRGVQCVIEKSPTILRSQSVGAGEQFVVYQWFVRLVNFQMESDGDSGDMSDVVAKLMAMSSLSISSHIQATREVYEQLNFAITSSGFTDTFTGHLPIVVNVDDRLKILDDVTFDEIFTGGLWKRTATVSTGYGDLNFELLLCQINDRSVTAYSRKIAIDSLVVTLSSINRIDIDRSMLVVGSQRAVETVTDGSVIIIDSVTFDENLVDGMWKRVATISTGVGNMNFDLIRCEINDRLVITNTKKSSPDSLVISLTSKSQITINKTRLFILRN